MEHHSAVTNHAGGAGTDNAEVWPSKWDTTVRGVASLVNRERGGIDSRRAEQIEIEGMFSLLSGNQNTSQAWAVGT